MKDRLGRKQNKKFGSIFKKKKKRREIGQNTIRKKKGNNNLKERQESIDI